MLIRNLRDRPVTIAPADGKPFVVDGGESVEVDDRLGESLLEQVDRWVSVDAPAKKQRQAPAGAESKSEEG